MKDRLGTKECLAVWNEGIKDGVVFFGSLLRLRCLRNSKPSWFSTFSRPDINIVDFEVLGIVKLRDSDVVSGSLL
jgi:hypothetical protein